MWGCGVWWRKKKAPLDREEVFFIGVLFLKQCYATLVFCYTELAYRAYSTLNVAGLGLK